MKHRIIIVVLILLSIAACSTPLTQREARVKAYLNKHPDISFNIKKQLINEQISIGMTKEMVEASWGKPYYIEKVVEGADKYENWVYTRDLARNYCCALPQVVKFENGKVVGWVQRMEY